MSTPTDAFSSTALKLSALFGLSGDARVLIAGRHYAAVEDDFASVFSKVEVATSATELGVLPTENRFDLVCLDLFTGGSVEEMERALHHGKELLAPGGYLWIAGSHCGSLARILGSTPSLPDAQMVPPSRILEALGDLPFLQKFLVIPGHSNRPDYVSASLASTKTTEYGPFIDRMLARLRLTRFTHCDYQFIAAAGESDARLPLLTALEAELPKEGSEPIALRALAMRARGAVIAHCAAGRNNFIVRLALEQSIKDRVRRNAECTDRLHALTGLAPRFKALIPQTLSRFTYGEAEAFVEQRMPGVEVWRFPVNSSRALRAIKEAGEFIDALSLSASEAMRIDAVVFRELFPVALVNLPRLLQEKGIEEGRLYEAIQHLERLLLGRQLQIGIGHGDFHLGNILADPRTGAITGVVDWDTYVEREIAGVDRAHFNLLLKSQISGRTILQCALDDEGQKDTSECVLTKVALLRIVERTALFPGEFDRRIPELMTLLRAVAQDSPAH